MNIIGLVSGRNPQPNLSDTYNQSAFNAALVHQNHQNVNSGLSTVATNPVYQHQHQVAPVEHHHQLQPVQHETLSVVHGLYRVFNEVAVQLDSKIHVF